MFTRSHFETVATLISRIRNRAEKARQASEFCATFTRSNPRFDKTRFLTACGIPQAPASKSAPIGDRPAVGQTVTVRGLLCRIAKVHPAGTIDVHSIHTDHAFRVSGLPFTG